MICHLRGATDATALCYGGTRWSATHFAALRSADIFQVLHKGWIESSLKSFESTRSGVEICETERDGLVYRLLALILVIFVFVEYLPNSLSIGLLVLNRVEVFKSLE
jgi:hypothetical protein